MTFLEHQVRDVLFDPQTHAFSDQIDELDLEGGTLDPILNDNNDNADEEYLETLIDKNEMMETSDDQDILGSPHSSFSYDDTLSDQEIDGLTNYNIILEYPQLTFENVQLLPFFDELNDWFSFKDLKKLKTISKISENISINDLSTIKQCLDLLLRTNKNGENNGKILQYLLHLSYISMGSFGNAKDQLGIKEAIFGNVLEILECCGLIDLVLDIITTNAMKLTEPSNLEESKVDLIQVKLLSNQFFYALTILFIILISFNSQELNNYHSKRKLSDILNEKKILKHLLKSIDRWKWISNNTESDDPTSIIESMSSKLHDNEKIQIIITAQFKIRNVLSIFNNLIIFQFGDLQHIQSTKDFLKFKFENIEKTDRKANSSCNLNQNNQADDQDNLYSISSLDYNYYVNELLLRYPTYTPPKFEMSEVLEMIINNNDANDKISNLINVDSLLINQHQHLKNRRDNFHGMVSEPPDIHIATPMPSPTLTPQHTGNTRNCSNISEFEHTSNEIKKKLYITQSNFPNIYPSSGNIPKSIEDATNIFFHHIKDNFTTKQFSTVFEEFINKENGYTETNSKNNSAGNYIYTDDDIKENPMFEDEIRSLQNVENFYKEGVPYFNSLISITLKLLISNIIPTQQSSENGKTRQRTTSKENSSTNNNKPYISSKLTTFEKQKLEISKMRETMLKNSTSIILLIQKWFKLSHILKFEFFTTLLFDQDFLIFLFRYLDSNKIQAHSSKDNDINDSKNLLNNRIVYCDYKVLYYLEDYNFFRKCLAISKNPNKEFEKFDELNDFEKIFEKRVESKENINPLSFILPFVPHNQVFTVINPNLRCCILISNLLQSMYYTISHFKIQRIYKLIGVRPTEILRFYLTLHNKLFYLPILKTIKLISPFVGKKWRSNNMDLISFVYLFHKVGLKDPWLNNFFNLGIEENTKRGFDNEVSIRSMIKFYNFQNYNEELSKHGYSQDCLEFMNEVERLGGDFFARECIDIGL